MTTADPSPALMHYRARHLASVLDPVPDMPNGPVAPPFAIEYDIIRDWLAHHPASGPRFDEVFARFRAAHAELAGLLVEGFPYPTYNVKLTEASGEWRAMRAFLTEEPWSSFSWAKVFADRIAAMEMRVARRLGVDLARVYRLFEHVLPDRDGQLSAKALIRDVVAGFDEATAPLYSAATLAVVLDEAAAVSDVLVYTIRQTNIDQIPRETLREMLAQEAGLAFTKSLFRESYFTFALQKFGQGPKTVEEAADYLPRYQSALGRLDEFRRGFSRLEDSVLRTVLLEEIDFITTEMQEEAATLPARAVAAGRAGHERPPAVWPTHAEWRSAMPVGTLTSWVETLRTFHLPTVADSLVPAAVETPKCAFMLTHQSTTPLEVEPLREPVVARE